MAERIYGPVHLRSMIGRVGDYNSLFTNALRCLTAGGFLEIADKTFVCIGDNGLGHNSSIMGFPSVRLSNFRCRAWPRHTTALTSAAAIMV